MTFSSIAAVNPLARVVGDDLEVLCGDGQRRRYVNLDTAATTPPLQDVAALVAEFSGWYSSVHRGGGPKARVATAAYEGAREAIAAFCGARCDDVVLFVKNTTEATNLLSTAISPDAVVLSTPMEHHANMLPWRHHHLKLLPFSDSADDFVESISAGLANHRVELVAISGASNVTGDILPIRVIAELAHSAGARLFVDAAQLAPHRAIDMAEMGIDFLALSGHKLYAPYGSGALIGSAEALRSGRPLLLGGGAVLDVTIDDVRWAHLPAKYEAGSPNVLGAVALGVACDRLTSIGMPRITEHEHQLGAQLFEGLSSITEIKLLELWPAGECDRLAVATFCCRTIDDRLLATVLGDEYGVAVRSGRFCAHPLVEHLLDTVGIAVGSPDGKRHGGAVRASVGISTTSGDIQHFLDALKDVFTHPTLPYELDIDSDAWRRTDGFHPAPPELGCRLAQRYLQTS